MPAPHRRAQVGEHRQLGQHQHEVLPMPVMEIEEPLDDSAGVGSTAALLVRDEPVALLDQRAKSIVPGSAAGVWALTHGAQLVSVLPTGLIKAVAKLNIKGVRLYDTMQYKEYSANWPANHRAPRLCELITPTRRS
jgi:hypothetical protein